MQAGIEVPEWPDLSKLEAPFSEPIVCNVCVPWCQQRSNHLLPSPFLLLQPDVLFPCVCTPGWHSLPFPCSSNTYISNISASLTRDAQLASTLDDIGQVLSFAPTQPQGGCSLHPGLLRSEPALRTRAASCQSHPPAPIQLLP